MQALPLNQIPEETITLTGITPGEIKEIPDSAEMVLRGICEYYADAVFIEETGESKCLEFPFGEASQGSDIVEDDEVWVPF